MHMPATRKRQTSSGLSLRDKTRQKMVLLPNKIMPKRRRRRKVDPRSKKLPRARL